MKVFISYHRKDTFYRHQLENILQSQNIDYYAVPENADFNGKRNAIINEYICNKLKKCDILICLVGTDTYSRPHVDREIHTALKGNPGKRLGVIGIFLPTRKDSLNTIDLNTFPTKLWDNKNYVIWAKWKGLSKTILELITSAKTNSLDKKIQTNHSNPCMALRSKIYYDN